MYNQPLAVNLLQTKCCSHPHINRSPILLCAGDVIQIMTDVLLHLTLTSRPTNRTGQGRSLRYKIDTKRKFCGLRMPTFTLSDEAVQPVTEVKEGGVFFEHDCAWVVLVA